MGERVASDDGNAVPAVNSAVPAVDSAVPAVDPVPAGERAPDGGQVPALLRARAALLAAADALCEAHDYAAAARTLRVAWDAGPSAIRGGSRSSTGSPAARSFARSTPPR